MFSSGSKKWDYIIFPLFSSEVSIQGFLTIGLAYLHYVSECEKNGVSVKILADELMYSINIQTICAKGSLHCPMVKIG